MLGFILTDLLGSGNSIFRGDANVVGKVNGRTYELQEFSVLMEEREELAVAESAGEEDEIHILLGEDLGPALSGGPYGFVFKRYITSGNTGGEIGVIGPARLNYTYVVPAVRYYGNLIQEVAKGW